MKISRLEPTPNPNAFKFNLDQLVSRRPCSFGSKEEAKDDSIAGPLFELDGVASVFYLQKFITVEKTEEADWQEVMSEVGRVILDFEDDVVVLDEADDQAGPAAETDEEKALLQEVEGIFDEMVRPALANDGGGLDIVAVSGKTIFIQYQGACGTCPNALRGTLMAIENLLHKAIGPEVSVQAG